MKRFAWTEIDGRLAAVGSYDKCKAVYLRARYAERRNLYYVTSNAERAAIIAGEYDGQGERIKPPSRYPVLPDPAKVFRDPVSGLLVAGLSRCLAARLDMGR